MTLLIKESGLFVFDAEFAVNGGEDTLHLSEGEHTAEKGVAGIVSVAALVENATRLISEGHTVIYTHRQFRILFLEDTTEFDEVCSSAKMAGLREVTVGEDMAGTQVYEVGT